MHIPIECLIINSKLLVDQSLPDFFANAGGIAVDILVFPFWISRSLPEIFAIENEVGYLLQRFLHESDSRPEALYNLGSGS